MDPRLLVALAVSLRLKYLGLNCKAPRASAGKAFIDFFLSAESMKLLAKAREFVTLKGIPQLLPDADKIQAVEMDTPQNETNTRNGS